MARPTYDAVALAALLAGQGWQGADEIADAVEKLGFTRPSSQWLAARLTAMCKESAPRFQRRRTTHRFWEYHVTRWALTGLENEWPGLRQLVTAALPAVPNLPLPKPEERE